MRRTAGLFIFLAGLVCQLAPAQQLAFTSRAHIQSPLFIGAIESSGDYGFESVIIRNDTPEPVIAVRFSVTLHSGSGDEVAEERRIAMQIQPHETKRITLGMAQIKGLKDRLRSQRQYDGLAILTVEALEFRDGTEWKRPLETNTDLPVEPAK